MFTYENYRFLLRDIKSQYTITTFQQKLPTTPFAIIRHDIDFDVMSALRMGEIDAAEGISANYFFLLTSPHYNVWENINREAICKIRDLGHNISIHFDVKAYDINSEEQLRKAILDEVNVFESLFKVKINAISFHRPQSTLFGNAFSINDSVEHTYLAKYFSEIKYFSDSRGMWRDGLPTKSQAFKEKKSIQVLVHPIWWQESHSSTHDVLDNMILNRIEKCKNDIAKNCDIYVKK